MKNRLGFLLLVALYVLLISSIAEAVKIEFDESNSTGSVSMAVSAYAYTNSDSDSWQGTGTLYDNHIGANKSYGAASATSTSSIKTTANGAYPKQGEQGIDYSRIFDFCFYQTCEGTPLLDVVIPAGFSSTLDAKATLCWKLLPSSEQEEIGMPVVVNFAFPWSVGSNSVNVTYEMGVYSWEASIGESVFGPYEVLTYCSPCGGHETFPETTPEQPLTASAYLGDIIKLSYHIKVDGHTEVSYWPSMFIDYIYGHSIRMGVIISVPECEFSIEDPVWVDEDDNMVLPYDEIELKFRVVNDGAAVDNARLIFSFNASPEWTDDPLIQFEEDFVDTGPIAAKGEEGSEKIVKNTIRIAGTSNTDKTDNKIMEIVVRNGKRLSLKDTVKVTLDCASEEFILSPRDKKKEEGGEILSIQYPDFRSIAEAPASPDICSFYRLGGGDSDFHHPGHAGVRKYAIEASVYKDDEFPDDLSDIMFNIYNFVVDLLNEIPTGYHINDIGVVEKIKNGDLEVGNPKEPHVCSTQAYLVTSFARTIGVPARELTSGLATGFKQTEDGYKAVFAQEAAPHIWFDGRWHLYDTWERVLYLVNYLNVSEKKYFGYVTWHNYDRSERLQSGGLKGHDFTIRPTGIPLTASEWHFGEQNWRPGAGFTFGSPTYACLVDGQGNRTGYVDGTVVEEIPESYYVPAGSQVYANPADPASAVQLKETIFAAGSGQHEDYSLVITGTDDGHYDLTLAYVHEDGTIDGSSITFDIRKEETHTYEITVTSGGEISFTKIASAVDVDPDTLNLKSKGKWITVYIELPEGFDVSQIDGSTVTADDVPAFIGKEGWARAEATTSNILDHDGDGRPERMVKFDKPAIQNAVELGEVMLTVSGDLVDGTKFEGTDAIRVIDKGGKK